MKSVELPHRWMTLAYDDVGSGFPVVLLHAFPFDRTMWTPQLGPLSAAGFRVLAPDLPEFGHSTPCNDTFTIERAADVIADFLEALRIRSAVVGGLSMGGYITMAFARRHPTRAAALIFADTRAAPDDEAGRMNRDNTIAVIRAEGPAKVAESMLAKLLSEHTRKTKPQVVEFAREIATRQTESAMTAALYALRDRPDAAPGLELVNVPTLVLVGEFDVVTPSLAAARIAALVRGSELQHIPGAGHLSNLENPDAFNAAVVTFLKKLK
jgi:pimeloyl-ACP methyl ester carboxylesterase